MNTSSRYGMSIPSVRNVVFNDRKTIKSPIRTPKCVEVLFFLNIRIDGMGEGGVWYGAC